MWRLVAYLIATTAMAVGLSWLADRPGSLVVNWQGYEIETSVFRAIVLLTFVIGLSILVFSIIRQLWRSPATIGHYFTRRRQQRGLDALSSGMIAVGAGDRSLALQYAVQARKSLPNEPMTHLLRAQAAQLSGDRATSRRIFEAMLGTPDTEQLGLRGLFLEAEREGEHEAARQFAKRAVALNPKLGWAVDALFKIQCKLADWAGALETVAVGRKHGHFEKAVADRSRAVLLTAQAQALEDNDPERAMALAREAHSLAHDLVPAGAIAGRLLAARGNTPKAARVLQRAWKHAPHPDLATAYAFARLGDSPRDRLERVKQLALLQPGLAESAIAVATTAIDAREWDVARSALQPFLESRLTQRICTLMARIEGEQHGDTGRVREWLARAVNAPRDPAWTADGVVAEQWAPVSPVTGTLDAFQWRVPVEHAEQVDEARIAAKVEELVLLGTRSPNVVLASPAAGQPIVAEAVAPARPAAPAAVVIEAAAAKPAEPARAVPVAPPVAVTEPPAAAPAKATPQPPAANGAAAASAAKPKTAPSAEPNTPAAAVEPAPVKPVIIQVTPAKPQPAAEAKPAAAAAVPQKPAAAVAPPARKSAPVSKTESRIFVSPPAPDDPGTEPLDAMDEPRSARLSSRPPLKKQA